MRSKVRPGAERPYRRPRGPAAADIETHVMPKTCYLAGDRVRPRWRFCLVVINNTREDCRVQAVCIVQTSTRQTAQRTLSGNALKEMIAQGSARVKVEVVPEEAEASCRQAEQDCPAQAIEIEE